MKWSSVTKEASDKSGNTSKFSRNFFWFLALVLVTVWTRFYNLDNKPIHFDESINGWFVMRMFQTGFYKYDPTNYHGPLLFYIVLLFEALWGASLEVLRSVPATFSVLAVMIFAYRPALSRFCNSWLMLFVFLSPAFLFYGRSGIHEMPFVFFQMLLAVGFLRWLEKQDSTALAFVLIGAFGMVSLKETFAVSFACWFVAFLSLGPSQLKKSLVPSAFARVWSRPQTWLLLVLVAWLIGLFGAFGRNPAGLLDFFKAFLPWMKTGVEGHGHDKPFLYWLKVLWQAEPLVIVGMVCAVPGIFSKDKALRMLSVFSLLQFLIYSLIPYKTVWCVLTLVWGFYFVLAMTLEKIWHLKKRRGVLLVLMVIAGVWDLRSAWLSVYREPIDLTHPYVYVNTTYEFKNFIKVVQKVLHDNPELRTRVIQVGMTEQWPMPWVFRESQALHYQLYNVRMDQDALIYFAEPQDEPLVEAGISRPYLKVSMPIRQSRMPSVVYLDQEVFAPYFKNAVIVQPRLLFMPGSDNFGPGGLLEGE